MNIKGALAALLGEGAKHEEVQAELDSLRLENILHEHQSAGRLAADPETVEAARKLAAHDPDALGRVLTASRPIAASQTFTPPTGPVASDPTEAAIQQRMKDTGEGYSAAATEVAKGGKLNA